MHEALFTLDHPANEPIREHAPGSPERERLKACLAGMAGEQADIPLLIGGREVRTGRTRPCVMPHDHRCVLGVYHEAGPEEAALAAAAAREGWREWSALPWPERVSVFLRAAELLAGPWRSRVNAATMLGIGKNVYQAEIDAACELIDFFRFNAYFAAEIYSKQPASVSGIWDRLEWRPLEGFVLAVSPFNFTSIAGNLPSAPAMMGNTAVWKPAASAVYAAWTVMELLREAGLPGGVIQFLPGPGRVVGEALLGEADFAGLHFTGSTGTFRALWRGIGERIERYRGYPRIVGETGGKGFVVAHPSAGVDALVTALARGAFEYQGQKCSAASRAYIPRSLWPEVRVRLADTIRAIRMGDPRDFRNLMGAVIDGEAFERIMGYIEYARASADAEILAGGRGDASRGYYIEPTVVATRDPHLKLMEEEIFGPVLTVYVYPDGEFEETLALVDRTSPYALTGAVFAQDRYAIHLAHSRLRHAAGNFYVNDKPTGAVVGLQPFGGARASGTNDKSGSLLNLLRWVTPRTVKETFVPPALFTYPHMGAE
ncbi:MAG: L-glutamate gamma-semialdehyde dehydrogenase [Candidatus Eisenbacteria bacterium]|uniref:L-glutamate gamma-semialdehyde dehydrogenase n=1 Tax=Eiseniibacteriota bacterium TaxID=2212470 RepID=A0A938BPV6_UNCEI|nr:L-glutamate gamma-semialdehyde dehydrogenase [Candidatus Eisenbacteria bacterium]